MPAKADRIGDLYIAEKGNVNRMAEKKIGEIREELKAVDDEKLPSFIEAYEKDERSGVVKIVEQAKKRFEKLEAEKLRIENLKNMSGNMQIMAISAVLTKSEEDRLPVRW